jgi:hypothetical protein
VIINKLQMLLINHERSYTDDANLIFHLSDISKKRKEKEKYENEENEKKWEKLPSLKSTSFQLKFFIEKFGPKNSKKEFSNWKSAQMLNSASDQYQNKLNNVKKNKLLDIDDDDKFLYEEI